MGETAPGLNAEAKSEIARLMRETGITRSDLARALGVNRVCDTQMLDPSRNLTLDTLEKVVRKLGYTVHLECDKQFESRYRDDQ
jgi:plasmid maintenance system antidote protein VapI